VVTSLLAALFKDCNLSKLLELYFSIVDEEEGKKQSFSTISYFMTEHTKNLIYRCLIENFNEFLRVMALLDINIVDLQ
jgi:hypothetical protein